MTRVVKSKDFLTSCSLGDVDRAFGAVSRLYERRLVDAAREDELVRWALSRDADLLILAKHYGHDLDRLARHQQHLSSTTEDDDAVPDFIRSKLNKSHCVTQ